MPNRQSRLEKILYQQFKPKKLEVNNISAHHKGHVGDDGSNESHFQITLTSKQFKNLTRLEQHRLVTKYCQDEFNSGLHALSLDLKAE